MAEPQIRGEVYVREARPADQSALNRICLLTGDAGNSAEHLHKYGELIGTVYADPYVSLPTTWGFVMVDPAKDDAVVGYILGSYDTRAYERHAQDEWWPRVRAKYAYPPEANEGATEADVRFLNVLHNPPRAAQAQVDYSPAHMHIDILPEYQRQGWGRRLIGRAAEYLREKHGLERLWLGIDPRNEAARRFYERLGYKELPGAPQGTYGLEFKDFHYSP
ncbi:acyl-CoA N-acyltransferase [Dichomitus squalens]|uniref:Acyl-CoA N-acyltransferase n=1 Tax=Dichomitus squalens TaxID=114155 RepID=A0A4Q9PWQ1_9APHY|nr:acyl-CoA N-acyltransferase [Dichomitus squalens]TBU59122.1 acyl-CoA N-acyltransferase [Dichomitus squalens]